MKKEKSDYLKTRASMNGVEKDDSSIFSNATTTTTGASTEGENDSILTNTVVTHVEEIVHEHGPVHTLLKIASSTNLIQHIYRCDEKVVRVFVRCALSNVVGRRKWNKMCNMVPMGNIATASDEAFAMLVLENNASKWQDEVDNPYSDKKTRPKAVYSQGTKDSSCSNKWGRVGITRYLILLHMCMKCRNEGGKRVVLGDLKEEVLNGNKKVLKREVKELVHFKYNSIENMILRGDNEGTMDNEKRKRELGDLLASNEEMLKERDEKRKKSEDKVNDIMAAILMGKSIGGIMNDGMNDLVDLEEVQVEIKTEEDGLNEERILTTHKV